MEGECFMNDEEIFVGQLNLDADVRISDPCYEPDCWCSCTVHGFRPGIYNAYVVEDPEEGRVAELVICLEEADTSTKSRMDWIENDASVAVDSGQAGFFNEKFFSTVGKGDYDDPDSFYGECCGITLADEPYGVLGNELGVVSSSGYGDGVYPLYVVLDSNGKVIAAKIVFID